MQRNIIQIAISFTAALFLSSCDHGSFRISNELPFSEYRLNMMATDHGRIGLGKAEKVNDFQNSDEFRNVLAKLDPTLCNQRMPLRACLKKIRKQDERTGSKKLKGVAGITGYTFLRVAQSTLRQNGTFQKADVEIQGQIQEKCLHDTTLPGYAFDQDKKYMRFCVVMKTIIKHPGENESGMAPVPDPETRYQYFHVEATRDVAVDDGSGGSNDNVFPAAAAKTGIVIPKSKVDMFTPPMNHKLYAWGKRIRVMTYWETDSTVNNKPDWANGLKFARKANGQPPNIPGNIKDHKRLKDYFKEDKDACIDMMFYGAPPPLLDPNKHLAGVSYCLGRCKDPGIVNTR